ncbi:urea transporter [Xanthomarina sp. F2636L]|uniref:urea transporter n=1 Tax=Xanthomarina sp. F2636L TaxID=2996018 RepID=UPI00225E4B5B|nr:urea transporter [Xanthomarina sp. F2636L]MCX7549639.1 urea transporter [Xanthomarina sp. F2636L]
MKFTQIILRGIGQVIFQNNIYSGILFLVGIFYNSWLLAIAALLGTIISTGTAHVLKYPKETIQNGLYGFNGTLTGIAILCFFKPDLVSILALIIGSALSTVVMHFLMKIIPPFTAPFVLSTWLVIYSLVFLFKVPLIDLSSATANTLDVFSALSNSFGQVMFQENRITGLFFLLAILINNRLMAAYAFYAAALGSLTAWLLLESASTINAGLMGYNAILCAIALIGKRWRDFLWISIAILLSTFLNIGLAMTGIITLTAPFILATWIVMILKTISSGKNRII